MPFGWFQLQSVLCAVCLWCDSSSVCCGFFTRIMAPAISKRPAADVTTSTGSKKMKRPAAATGSLNKSVAELKAGLPDEEPDTSEGAARDKGKGEKWARMRANGQIPQHILHLYDETAKTATSTRDFRTSIINALFEKNDKGLFTMNTGHKMFVEAFKVYQTRFASDQETGMAKSLVMGLYFQNSEQAQWFAELGNSFHNQPK